MKTFAVKKPSAASNTAKQTTITPTASGSIRLWHQQGVKQSTHYQSGDIIYGLEIHVDNNPKAIAAGIKFCETIVENALGDKLPQMNALLKGLAQHNQ